MELLILFLFGATFGSFLNVVIDRLSTGRSISKGRSYCESCRKTLSWKELIPIISYIMQKGHCRHCKSKIPFRLFIVEILIAALFPSIFVVMNYFSWSYLTAFFVAVILMIFVGIFFSDITYGIIPDKLTITAFLLTFFYLISIKANLTLHLQSGIGAFLFFLFLFMITRGRGMGFGDVKLSLVLGLFLGFPNIVLSLYLAFLTGAFFSIILVVWKKISFSRGTIPFGPFLIFSAITVFFFGEKIIPLLLKYF